MLYLKLESRHKQPTLLCTGQLELETMWRWVHLHAAAGLSHLPNTTLRFTVDKCWKVSGCMPDVGFMQTVHGPLANVQTVQEQHVRHVDMVNRKPF